MTQYNDSFGPDFAHIYHICTRAAQNTSNVSDLPLFWAWYFYRLFKFNTVSTSHLNYDPGLYKKTFYGECIENLSDTAVLSILKLD